MTGLGEKNAPVAKLHSGVSCGAIGREFDINESVMYIKVSSNKNTHKTRSCMCWLTTMWPEPRRDLALGEVVPHPPMPYLQ